MDLGPYIADLADSLTLAAAAGDEGTRRTASVLVAALEPAARLALMSALSDLAAEVTDALGTTDVELRLDGRDVAVVVARTGQDVPGDEAPPPPPPSRTEVAGETTRITLRLPDDVKAQVEDAAGSQGVSVNTWLAQAVHTALHHTGRRGERRPAGGSHVSGWVTG
jgi:uncharacterized protein (DUF1778 family)